MACNVVRYQENASKQIRWGVLDGDILPLQENYATTRAFLEEGASAAVARLGSRGSARESR